MLLVLPLLGGGVLKMWSGRSCTILVVVHVKQFGFFQTHVIKKCLGYAVHIDLQNVAAILFSSGSNASKWEQVTSQCGIQLSYLGCDLAFSEDVKVGKAIPQCTS